MKKIIRFFRGRIQLFISILFGLIGGHYLSKLVTIPNATQLILSFDLGVILFLVLTFNIMFFSKDKDIIKRAALQDEGKIFVIFLVILSVITSLVAIVVELSIAKELHGIFKLQRIGLSALTILLSWFFIHLMFAYHYAHDYYLNLSEKKPGGLDFPGTKSPDYLDFFYFACSIGTSGQTADISFTDTKMRRAGTAHCVFTFFFNTTVMALTINILSDLL